MKNKSGEPIGMKYVIGVTLIALAAIFVALLITILSSTQALAATPEDNCIGNFGSWTGTAPDDGTCTFAANSNYAISHCGADSTYTETYDASAETTTTACTAVLPAQTSSSTPGGCRTEVRGPLEKDVVLWLCHGKNGSAAFPAGGCVVKCVISAGLPAAAARKMPGNSQATLYVRIATPTGEVSPFSYTVCFYVGDLNLDPPSIYRFASGSWALVAFGNANSEWVCANAVADGVFYLGEPKEKSSLPRV